MAEIIKKIIKVLAKHRITTFITSPSDQVLLLWINLLPFVKYHAKQFPIVKQAFKSYLIEVQILQKNCLYICCRATNNYHFTRINISMCILNNAYLPLAGLIFHPCSQRTLCTTRNCKIITSTTNYFSLSIFVKRNICSKLAAKYQNNILVKHFQLFGMKNGMTYTQNKG